MGFRVPGCGDRYTRDISRRAQPDVYRDKTLRIQAERRNVNLVRIRLLTRLQMVLTGLLFRFPWENCVVLRPRMPCAAQRMNLLRVALQR